MLTVEELDKFGFDPEEDEEVRKRSDIFTGYPKPLCRYRLGMEAFNMSIEEPYFWILEYLREYWGYPTIIKITDVFTAAENSSFFGASQQRLGLQQDKVSQFLATVGKMVKELFQLVRELRVLDERLGYYKDSLDSDSPSRGSAEITLKGIFVDMVEQGAKNPASVYGMAREVQFTTLPDLFFNTHPLRQEDVDEVVDKDCAQFNRKVREVLKRKLRSFLAWKEHTFEEICNRRIFTLKYLRQHYEIIKMYMMWVKPYLRNIERLHMDQQKMESPDVLVAFETSMIEIELLAVQEVKDMPLKKCIHCHFLYRTRPDMNYTQEYQRGPIHVGKVLMNFRGYAWSDEQIENYKKLRAREEFRLLGIVDSAVRTAMESLGDELMRYLEEAGEDFSASKGKKEEEEIKPEGKRFTSGFKSIRSLLGRPNLKEGVKSAKQLKQEEWNKQVATSTIKSAVIKEIWTMYHHFKKRHNLLNW